MGLNLTLSLIVSAALIVAQMILTDGHPLFLWGNWLAAGVLSGGLWYFMGHSHIGSIPESKVLALLWPLMSITLNFCYLYFPESPISHYQTLLLLCGQLCCVALVLLMWQGSHSPLLSLGAGLLMGLASALYPQLLLWLLLLPLLLFHMRASSSRNTLAVLTGVALGIWILYCYTLGTQPGTDFDSYLLAHYQSLVQPSPWLSSVQAITLWQWLYLLVLMFTTLLFGITTIAFGTGHTMRSRASLMLLCTICFAGIAMLPITPWLIATNLCQLSLLSGILLTAILANVRNVAYEWWMMLTLLLCLLLSILPLIL